MWRIENSSKKYNGVEKNKHSKEIPHSLSKELKAPETFSPFRLLLLGLVEFAIAEPKGVVFLVDEGLDGTGLYHVQAFEGLVAGKELITAVQGMSAFDDALELGQVGPVQSGG